MSNIAEVLLPDIGDFTDVDVIEILVSQGDHVNVDDSLVTLETDKATMEVPSPHSGVVQSVHVNIGDKVSEGTLLFSMEISTENKPTQSTEKLQEKVLPAEKVISTLPSPITPEPTTSVVKDTIGKPELPPPITVDSSPTRPKSHASPSVRRFARELGVNVSVVQGTGPKNRITKVDVQEFIKLKMTQSSTGIGFPVSPLPAIDFSKYGEIEQRTMSKIQQVSGSRLHSSWLTIPHVTQFDDADITELESFRKTKKDEFANKSLKLSILPFIIKACAKALKQYPDFNSSLASDGVTLIVKKYYHIGVAVDTVNGLVVPVIRDVDRKSILELTQELMEVSDAARAKKLLPAQMQGGSFSVSSLGGIGGTAFTPIINPPEVAILGVSKAKTKAEFINGSFQPRLQLPLSLSYDHRVIDGANATRFIVYLSSLISDIRNILI